MDVLMLILGLIRLPLRLGYGPAGLQPHAGVINRKYTRPLFFFLFKKKGGARLFFANQNTAISTQQSYKLNCYLPLG